MAVTTRADAYVGPTFEVAPARVDEVLAQMRRIAERAPWGYGRQISIGSEAAKDARGGEVRRIWVVSQHAPRIGGFVLVGRIEHKAPGLNVVRALCPRDLSQFRTAPPHCSHCQTRRDRRDTFVLEAQDGRLLQVGRSCLKDYSVEGGDDSVEEAVARADLLARLNAVLADASRGGAEWASEIPLEHFLLICAEFAMEHGFVGVKQAQDQGVPSTAQRALAAFRDGALPTPRPAAQLLAGRVLEWVRSLPEQGNEYLEKARKVCAGKTVSGSTAGTACSVIYAFRTRSDEQRASARRPEPAEVKGGGDAAPAVAPAPTQEVGRGSLAAFAVALEAFQSTVDALRLVQEELMGIGDGGGGLLVAKVDVAVNGLLDLADLKELRLPKDTVDRMHALGEGPK